MFGAILPTIATVALVALLYINCKYKLFIIYTKIILFLFKVYRLLTVLLLYIMLGATFVVWL